MSTVLLYAFLPNLFFSCMIAIEYIKPHNSTQRIPAFIIFTLLGVFGSFLAQFLLLTGLWIVDNKATPMDNILFNDKDKEDANQTQSEAKKAIAKENQIRKSSRVKKNIVGLVIIGLFITPFFFHIFPSKMRIIPKESFSIKHTIVTQNDIDEIIEKANEGEFFERVLFMQDPFFKILVEEEFIVTKNEIEKGY